MNNQTLRIFAGGIVTETNTFSPIPTGYNSFDVVRADDIQQGKRSFSEISPFDRWQLGAEQQGLRFDFGLLAYAQPAGLTTASAYQQLSEELLQSLDAVGPVDMVLLLLHGAMVADGEDDCEGALLARIRDRVGDDVVIAVELDLHCHLTVQMLNVANIIITFKEYPHVDIAQRADELMQLAVATCKEKINPVMAAVDCNILGMFPTSSPILRQYIDRLQQLEQQPPQLSISFIHGFPYGDVAEAGSKLLVITDNEPDKAASLANTLAQDIIGLKDRITFSSLSLPQAMKKALSLSHKSKPLPNPVVIADQSDNAGGGAPSDSTYALQWLLDNDIADVAMAIFYDPEVVRQCIAAGVGARLALRLGGKMGLSSGQPVDIVADVIAVRSDYIHQFPQQDGESLKINLGDTVALQSNGLSLVVSSHRSQCFCPSIFEDLSVPLNSIRLIVIKSTQHFYQAFTQIADHIIYMAAPGALSPQLANFHYQKLDTRCKYPWITDPVATPIPIQPALTGKPE